MKRKRYTIGNCFTTFMLPHILFVEDFQVRKKSVMICCLAWNISLFPLGEQRLEQINIVWKMVEADNQQPPPPGLEQGFKQELEMLIAQKRDLFPWIKANIPMAELSQKNRLDVLRFKTDGVVEEVELVTRLDAAGLPHIIQALSTIQDDTAAQVELMHQLSKAGRVFSDIETTHMATAYCVQRADLIGYHKMLTVWRDTQPAPSVKRVIEHWLDVLNEIELNSKKLLAILTEQLTQPFT